MTVLAPEPFLPLARRFRAVFLDSYGVLRDDAGPLPGVQDALAQLAVDDVPVFLLTNDASRGADDQVAPYDGAIPASRVVSAGLVAGRYLAQRFPRARVGVLGPPGCWDCFDGVDAVAFADLSAADLLDLAVVVLMDEAGWDWSRELNRLMQLLRARPELPWLAPNPDLIFPTREGKVALAAGSLAAMVQRVVGRAPRRFGKPDPAIFEQALALARRELGVLEPQAVLMVGDTLETDVLGAQRAGLSTALALSGNTPLASLAAAIERAGVWPQHVVTGLAP